MENFNPFDAINRRLDVLTAEIRKQNEKKHKPINSEWGDINFASEVTGYKPSTIYIKVSRNEMPHIKRDGKLWFSRSSLLKWIESGIIESLEGKK